MSDIYEQCKTCCARSECPAATQPGSIMCMMKRMGSGKTHGDEDTYNRYCPHCGKPIK